MKKIVPWLLIVCCLTLIVSPAFAASPWTESTTYGERTWNKLVFGFRNLAFGWTELFMQPAQAVQNGENVAAGIGKGFVYMIADTLGGTLHFLTAPAPIDIPLPENGVTF